MRRAGFYRIMYVFLLATAEFLYDVNALWAQKVGVVFSGGGSLGAAHVGALKALEENEIPIDCVTGTSAGAMAGGFYVSGYSPDEMLRISLKVSDRWLGAGTIYKEEYYFNKIEKDGSFIQIPLSLRNAKRSLPDALISDFEINLGYNEYMARAGWGQSFDSLMVPYRCMTADIFAKKSFPIGEGSLPFALRASMAVPFFFSPASNEKYHNLFDGGIYDNFPVQPMKEIFNPDIIIGINVAGGPSSREVIEQKGRFVRALLSQGLVDMKTWENMPSNGILIMPDLDDLSAADFSTQTQLTAYERGYEAAMACMDDIKAAIGRRISRDSMAARRKAFKEKMPPLVIDTLKVFGVKPYEQAFIRELFNPIKRRPLDFKDFQKGFYRLKSDGNYLSVFPELIYNPNRGAYEARLFVKPSPRFHLKFGGAFFTPTDHQIQAMIKYCGVFYVGYQAELDLMRGSFSNHARLRGRIDLPTRKPFFIEVENSIVQWDLQRLTFSLFNRDKSANVAYQAFELKGSLNFPLTHRSRISIGYAYQDISDRYFNPQNPVSRDTLDNTQFKGRSLSVRVHRNTLDKKMYATSGGRFYAGLFINEGTESYSPGGSLLENKTKDHFWAQARISYLNYIQVVKNFSVGVSFDAEISSLSAYTNLTATLLSSPKFQPLQDSPILYLPGLYAKAYAAPGLQFVYSLTSKIDVRFEGYYMQRLQDVSVNVAGEINQKFNFDVKNNLLSGTFGLTYDTPIGPVGAFINYYGGPQSTDFRPFIHLGYLVFREHPWR